MKILKFGGTSVGSPQSISTLVDIVRRQASEPGGLVVVVSAMGGVTNQLVKMAEAAESRRDFSGQLKELEKRHLEAISALVAVKHQSPVIMKIKIWLNELDEILSGVSALKELSPRTRDSILSYGELCSAALVSGVLSQYVPETVFADARELILTDSFWGNARVDFAATDARIRAYFQAHPGALPCVTGFIASDAEGHTTTLGRGGSDYSASVIGAAMHASEIQIWTDVDGFMTADPRMVEKAFSLPEISYTEAMELSYFGAKVIYPPTMIPAFQHKIPIVIRNTFNPSFPGTFIREHSGGETQMIRGIASVNDIVLVNIQGSGMVGKAGFSGRLFSTLARDYINVILITQGSSEHSITFAVSPEDAEKARRALEAEFEMELLAHKLDAPRIEKSYSIVAVVGENMKNTPGISGKLFSALGRNGVNVAAIAQGSSEYNISVVVLKDDLAKTLNLVHEAFFLSPIKTLNVFYLGVGNIGKTLLRQIQEHEQYLLENNRLRIQVIAITNTRKMVIREQGIPFSDWESLFETDAVPANLDAFFARMKSLNLPNSVFIDNSASASVVRHYEGVLASSISIVTCNKLGNSGPYAQYRRFKDAERKHDVDFLYETNVGAGLPIIKTLQDLLVSGDRILRIEAILSGTISYIFNEFRGDRHFHDIVAEAQQKGFTEPDPRDDLSGLDFMRKMLILGRDSGNVLEMDDIQIERILPEPCMKAPTVEAFYEELKKEDAHFEQMKQAAEQDNKVLRYIGILENGAVSIRLEAVDQTHPFYSLSGSDNIIAFTTSRYKQRPLVVKGPGAGAEVTAAGVFADLVKVGAR
jgi:aspartokinase/homoserine dehydrogenase 1